jgi:hypothetical protein
MSDLATRRNALLVGTAAVVAGGLAGCSSNIDIVKTVADLIQKIQAGVSAGLSAACGVVNKWVPTVDSVLLVVEGFLGAAVTQFNLAGAVTFIRSAIDAIVKAGCPPTPSPAPSAAPHTVTVSGKVIHVSYY